VLEETPKCECRKRKQLFFGLPQRQQLANQCLNWLHLQPSPFVVTGLRVAEAQLHLVIAGIEAGIALHGHIFDYKANEFSEA
jgi:hypothetical protein